MLVLVFLDLDAIRVVRPHLVQRNDVDEYQGHQDEGHEEVEGKEAVERHVGDDVVAAYPNREVLTDPRHRREQVDDDLCTPIGHLAPGKQVAKEGRRHHGQIDNHADDPQ